MSDTPSTSAELVGHVLEQTSRLAKSRRRLANVASAVLLMVVIGLGVSKVHDDSVISALQKKSGEQTIAEIELRHDVNTLSAANAALTATNKAFTKNHAGTVNLFCELLSAVHDQSTVYMQYCPATIP